MREGLGWGTSPAQLRLPWLHPSTNINLRGTLQHPGVAPEPSPGQDGDWGTGTGEGARRQHSPVCPLFVSLHLPGGAWS